MAEQPTVESTPEGMPSFVRITKTKRGRYISSDYFKVRPNDYGNGWRDGEAAAREYMGFLVGKGRYACDFPLMLRAIAAAMDDPAQEVSRYGAAVGFARAIETILSMTAQIPAFQQFVQHSFPSWADIEASDRKQRALGDRKFQRALRRIVTKAKSLPTEGPPTD